MIGPRWLAPTIELALLLPLSIATHGRNAAHARHRPMSNGLLSAAAMPAIAACIAKADLFEWV
ncbi:MAG: hypothetical protein WA730_05345, partial [Pseudolabrys sp.]